MFQVPSGFRELHLLRRPRLPPSSHTDSGRPPPPLLPVSFCLHAEALIRSVLVLESSSTCPSLDRRGQDWRVFCEVGAVTRMASRGRPVEHGAGEFCVSCWPSWQPGGEERRPVFWVWTFPSVGLRFPLVTWREVAWNPRWLLGNIWAQPSCGPF